ncbi:MAG: ABC transporter permease subunit [Thermoplasmatota archaeon]
MSFSPQSDYRRYTHEYLGRWYRFYRVVVNNLALTLKKKSVIAVISVSFLFLFFNILGIVFSAPAEMMENEFTSIPEDSAVYDLVPVDDQAEGLEVMLGQTLNLSYVLTNIGNGTDTPILLFFPPNKEWEYSMDIGEAELSPGYSAVINITLTIPDNREDFSKDLDGEPFLSSYYEPGRDGKEFPVEDGFEDPVSIMREMLGGPYTHFGASVIYEYKISRLVMVYVIPGDMIEKAVESVEEGDYYGFQGLLDARITSTATLIRLDPSEPGAYMDPDSPIPRMGFDQVFDLEVLEIKGKIIRSSIYSDDDRMLNVRITNTGTKPVDVRLESLLMPLYWEWSVEIWPLHDPEKNPEGLIYPGEHMDFEVWVLSGPSGKLPYNLVLLGTDTSREEYRTSESVHIVLDVKGARPDKDLEQEYYDIFWGGGFSYNRFLWMILLAAVAGSGLVANDLKNNTLSLYFSRPVLWLDYMLGKSLSLFVVLSLITALPAVIMYTTLMAFKSVSILYMLEHLWLLGGAFLAYTIALLLFTSVSLALSSLSKRWIVAGVGIFSVFMVTPVVSDLLGSLFDNKHFTLINIYMVMRYSFRPLFGLEYNTDSAGYSYILNILVLSLIIMGCWTVITFRFRGREVVK